jgi:hypothetical protein
MSKTEPAPAYIPVEQAVAEGKEIVANIKKAERSRYRLGELAHKVVNSEYTLAEYAKAIGEKHKRLEEARSVWRAWGGEGIFAPGQVPFAVLKELMAVEDRGQLVIDEPNMTKRRAEVHRVLKDHPHCAEILSTYPYLNCTNRARDVMLRYDTGDVPPLTDQEEDEDQADDVTGSNTIIPG